MEESKIMMEAFIETHGTEEEWYNDGKQTWHNALASFKYGWEACKERLLTQRAVDGALPSENLQRALDASKAMRKELRKRKPRR